MDGVLSLKKFTPVSLAYSNLVRSETDSILNWRLKENFNGFYKGAQFNTNSDGFRSEEFDIKEKSNNFRIAILGRSIAAGVGVEVEESWVGRLRRSLKVDAIPVYNFSVPGYNFFQVEQNFYKNISKFNANVLVVPIYLMEWDFPILKKNPPFLHSYLAMRYLDVNFYFEHFYIYFALRSYVQNQTAKFLSTDWETLGKDSISGPNITKVSRVLPRLTKWANENECKIFFVVIPRPGLEHGEYKKQVRSFLNDWISQFENTYIINADIEMRLKYDFSNTIYYGDPHPNRVIHEELSKIILKHLQRELVGRGH